ncbi:hypothetical protein AQ914_04560 [Burkholderia pseudomallei]|uniref:type III secretion system inner rod subunit SctI n=1 Tax=Burkholderia pseudomallei TaxID=28450 RepID=UPI0009768309|nr:type III secretion system inner rod subunit SctI [Burkholderia pseudomallei]ONC26357.1 hypothetical protein AQ914_04560 [Burkholderia pseudomallei]
MNISNLQLAPKLPDLSETQSSGQGASLDSMVAHAFNDLDTTAQADKTRIESRFANPTALSNPANLLALQNDLSNYNIYVSLASTFSRKAVSTVETLVKGQ